MTTGSEKEGTWKGQEKRWSADCRWEKASLSFKKTGVCVGYGYMPSALGLDGFSPQARPLSSSLQA